MVPDAFSKHIRDTHDEVRRKITTSNGSYKTHADLRRNFEFNEEYMVKVRIRRELYPKGTFKKLRSRSVAPHDS